MPCFVCEVSSIIEEPVLASVEEIVTNCNPVFLRVEVVVPWVLCVSSGEGHFAKAKNRT